MASDILVVDDEADIRELVCGILDDEGHETRSAHDADSALAAISDRVPRLVFLDIWLQGSRLDGLALLDEIKSRYPELPVVMISGHGNIETAVSAIRRGAYDFIEKPFKADRLVLVAERALETSNLRKEVSDLKRRSGDPVELIGTSLAISQLKQTIEKVAPTNSRIMIMGPSGSGKELVARLIHKNSSRANGPFVVLNAAGLTPERMEIALFGTESTSSHERKVGVLEEAHRGILYLDEVADMPRGTQNKILRVLTEQRFQRVGGKSDVHVDVRVMSASTKDLKEEIAAQRFREDLFYRLSVVPIRVPSLAERRDDIPALIDHFTGRIADSSGLNARTFSSEAIAVLQSMDWPGNVRQLKNLVERILILSPHDAKRPVSVDELPQERSGLAKGANPTASADLVGLSLRDAREQFEREYLSLQITRFDGNISRTAEFIGMERSALHRKLKALGVNASASRSDV